MTLHVELGGRRRRLKAAFQRWHPGGREVLAGHDLGDATMAFYAVHPRAVIDRVIRSRPGGRDVARDRQTRLYIELHDRYEARGWFERDAARELLKALTLAALTGLALALQASSIWLSGLVLGVVMQQLGWATHDSCHHKTRWSRVMAQLYGSVALGISCAWWRDKHNMHHVFTNHRGLDPDIDTVPLYYLWPPERAGIHRAQHLYYPLLYTFLGFHWRIQSVLYAVRRRAHGVLALLAVHYLLVFSLFDARVFLLANVVGGVLVAVVVTSTHQSEPMLDAPHDGRRFVELQLLTTRNVVVRGRIAGWLWGGMQHQIEHHLFPKMPRYYYPRIQADIQALCAREGWPYKQSTQWEVLRLNHRTLVRHGRVSGGAASSRGSDFSDSRAGR